MADILHVTTPLVNRAQLPESKQQPQSDVQFQLSDITRVIKTNDGKESILQQNNTLIEHETQTVLMNMLKDPAAAVMFIKNIFMLQQSVQMLPLNNDSLTKEMGDLVKQLMLSGDEVAGEMKDQAETATLFKGEFFDILRSIVKQYNSDVKPFAQAVKAAELTSEQLKQELLKSNPEIDFSKYSVIPTQTGAKANPAISEQAARPSSEQANILQNYSGETVKYAVANLLRAINYAARNDTILDSVANSLEFLAQRLKADAQFSEPLANLSNAFRQENAAENFGDLKRQLIELLNQIPQSVLFTESDAKVTSMTTYTLSRYNDNPDFFSDALNELLQSLGSDVEKDVVLKAAQEFADKFNSGFGKRQTTKTMDVLAQIIEFQAAHAKEAPQLGERLSTVVRSLLSSPCNYTPLLHFVIPYENETMRSFAEMWINPNEDEDDPKRLKSGDDDTYTHILAEFDIADIGQIEMEMAVRGERIILGINCPDKYVSDFSDIGPKIIKATEGMKYKFEQIDVKEMETPRSLIEVFKSLPYRRSGIDVRA